MLLGVAALLTIGIFHPIVIKAEYYFSKSIWPVFLLAGIALFIISALSESLVCSALYAIVGAGSLWSIHELFQQEKRVKKGWFPKNPKKIREEKR